MSIEIASRNLMLDAYLIANEASIKQDLVGQGWNPNYINIPNFQQDIYGSKYKDEDGIEIITEPTFNWYTSIFSQRLSDGEFFYCRLVVLNEELENNKSEPERMMAILDEDFNNAIETMKELGLCETCGVNKEKKCEIHS